MNTSINLDDFSELHPLWIPRYNTDNMEFMLCLIRTIYRLVQLKFLEGSKIKVFKQKNSRRNIAFLSITSNIDGSNTSIFDKQ